MFYEQENTMMTEESEALIIEAAIMEAFSGEEISAALENSFDIGIAIDECPVLEKTIVKLDKKAKKNKLVKMCEFTIAKEKNDPKFKKLLYLWKMERIIEEYFHKRYGSQAERRAKQMMRNKAKSKSNIVANAMNKVARQNKVA